MPSDEGIITVDLVARAKKGEGEAFNQLYFLYEKRLAATVRKNLDKKLRARRETTRTGRFDRGPRRRRDL